MSLGLVHDSYKIAKRLSLHTSQVAHTVELILVSRG